MELGEPEPSGAFDTDVDVDSTVSYSTGRGIYSLQCCSVLSLYWLFATGAGSRPGPVSRACLVCQCHLASSRSGLGDWKHDSRARQKARDAFFLSPTVTVDTTDGRADGRTEPGQGQENLQGAIFPATTVCSMHGWFKLQMDDICTDTSPSRHVRLSLPHVFARAIRGPSQWPRSARVRPSPAQKHEPGTPGSDDLNVVRADSQ